MNRLALAPYRLLTAAAVFVVLVSTGCTVSRPSHIDAHLNDVIAKGEARPELAPATVQTTKVALVMQNGMPPDARIAGAGATSASELGDLYNAGERLGNIFAMGFREENDYLTTKEPLESYVGRSIETVLRAKGVAVDAESPKVLSVVVDLLNLSYDFDFKPFAPTSGTFICKLEITAQVLGQDGTETGYRRQFITEASAERGSGQDFLTSMSPLAGGLAGKADESALAVLEGVFQRMQDEMLADSEFWNALQ